MPVIIAGYIKARVTTLPDVGDLTSQERTELRKEFKSICRRGNDNKGDAGDDTISAKDLALLCFDLKIDLKEPELQSAIDAADKDKDISEGGKSTLNFEEFLIMIHDAEDGGASPKSEPRKASLSMVVQAFDNKRHVQATYALAGVLVFLMYPGICQLSFAALRCRTLPGDVSVLEADYSIDCNSTEYRSFFCASLNSNAGAAFQQILYLCTGMFRVSSSNLLLRSCEQ